MGTPSSDEPMQTGCHHPEQTTSQPDEVSSQFEEVSSQYEQIEAATLDMVTQEQEQAWRDAVDDTNSDAVRFLVHSSSTIDQRLLCDIQ